ncbi:MAG: LTA synthase family protein [Lachnospiraceae bacterium]|nr:LTA synthase family protein [Lachnospiraceae bacterium]
MKSFIKWDIKRVLVIFIYSCIFVIGMEFTAHKDIVPVLTWIKDYPLYVFLTVLALAFVFYAIAALTNFFVGSIIVGLISYAFGTVNYFKYSMRKDFLTGDDIYNFFHGNLEFSKNDADISAHLFIFLAIYIIMTVISFFIARRLKDNREFKYRWYMRTIGLFTGILLSALTCVGVYMQENIYDFMGDSDYIGNKYGITLGYIPANTLPHTILSDGYKKLMSNDYVRKGKEYVSSDATVFSKNDIKIKPNIICIMSESLYDTAHFDNVKYDIDPMEDLNYIRDNYGGGTIEVDIFGGGTANTEWEFLTGMGHKYFASNLMYYQYKEGSGHHSSMVSYMKDLGYHTVAIHPYKESFFNRDKTYKAFGFDEMYFRENMTHTDELFDVNISDYALTDEILEKYENLRKDSDEPFFNFSISVGSHKPCLEYDEGEPYEYNRKVKVLPLKGNYSSSTSRDIIRYYNAVYEAGDAFRELCDYFAKVDYPTVILMFGDHAPPLSDEAYDELTTKDLSDYELFETPVICYNNYDLPKFNADHINTNYLSTEFFKYIGFPLPKALVYNDNLMKYWYQCDNKKVTIDVLGNEISKYKGDILKMEEASLSLYQKELKKNKGLKDIWSVPE